MTALLALASTEAAKESFHTPYYVGGTALLILIVLLLGVIFAGNGREHS